VVLRGHGWVAITTWPTTKLSHGTLLAALGEVGQLRQMFSIHDTPERHDIADGFRFKPIILLAVYPTQKCRFGRAMRVYQG
jgi:hypothetical protein